MFNKVVVIMLLVMSGCNISGMNEEMDDKTEYSILQAYEYDYREVNNDKPYMVFKNAMTSHVTVIAFPIKNKSKGYVVMLAQAEGSQKTKIMPKEDFIVTKKTFAEVKEITPLSKEVEQFIAVHVR